jgi:hypothetical protein
MYKQWWSKRCDSPEIVLSQLRRHKKLDAVPYRIVALTARLAISCIAAAPLSVTIPESSIRHQWCRASERAGRRRRQIHLTRGRRKSAWPQDTYVAGFGVRVYAWRDAGIHMQRGFRESDKGKIFKLQVWFVDTYDKDEDKHSGKFNDHVQLDELDITPDTNFESRVRDYRRSKCYQCKERRDHHLHSGNYK